MTSVTRTQAGMSNENMASARRRRRRYSIIRRDSEGEYHYLVTAWKATDEEEKSYAENV